MKDSLAILCATCIAILIPASLVGGFSQSASVFIIACCISGANVLVLGLPAFLVLRRFEVLRWWSVVLAGFTCGIIPMAIISWPYWQFSGASYTAWDGSKMTEYVVNGVPTVAGWWSYAYGVTGIGLFGAVSGLGAWLTYASVSRSASIGTHTLQNTGA